MKLVFAVFVLQIAGILVQKAGAQEPACQALFMSPKLQKWYWYRDRANHEVGWIQKTKDSVDSNGTRYFWLQSDRSDTSRIVYIITDDQQVYDTDKNEQPRYHLYSLCIPAGAKIRTYKNGFDTYDGYGYRYLLGEVRMCHRITEWYQYPYDSTRPETAMRGAYNYIIDSLGWVLREDATGSQIEYETVAVLFDGRLIGDQTVDVTEEPADTTVPAFVRAEGNSVFVQNTAIGSIHLRLYDLLGQLIAEADIEPGASATIQTGGSVVSGPTVFAVIRNKTTNAVLYSGSLQGLMVE